MWKPWVDDYRGILGGDNRTTQTAYPSLTGMSVDLEEQARRILGLVVSGGEPDIRKRFPTRPDTCPNCGMETDSERSPYCSVKCREIAGFVRQVRAAIASGAIDDSERQMALGQVLWGLLGGGYPLRIAQVQPRAIAMVMKRTEGRCEICKAPATTIDHIKTACNRPINLRAVCATCNRTRPFGDSKLIGDNPLIKEIAGRVGSSNSVRCCDDPKAWNWREYLNLRKVAIYAGRNTLT